eukprot:jgi/Ulvmu1/9254/UM050_0003.1
MMFRQDEQRPQRQPRSLLDAADAVLGFAFQHSQRSLDQHLQQAKNELHIAVDTLRLWSTYPDVHSILYTHTAKLTDAISYKCTKLLQRASPNMEVQPLRIYIVPEQELAPMIHSMQQLLDVIHSGCSPTAMTCTILGMVTCISAPTSIPYGLCYKCPSCKTSVLIFKSSSEGDQAVCPCGTPLGGVTPLQHMHTVHLATVRLPGQPLSEDIEIQVSAQVATKLSMGSHYEMIVRVSRKHCRLPLALLDSCLCAASVHPLHMVHLRSQQLQCPAQQAERLTQSMPLQQLINLMRTASQTGCHPAHVTWYMALAPLVSAVAIGECHRQAKIQNNTLHRCQVHLLWLGTCMSMGAHAFIHKAAQICSPIVEFVALNDSLQPHASTNADGTMRFHGGKLMQGSQGVVVVNLASMTKPSLQKVHAYARDCMSAPKNRAFVSAPHMPNTATCWALADTEGVVRNNVASAMERLEAFTGGLVVPHFDLLVNVEDDSVNDELAADCILGMVDHCTPDKTSADEAVRCLRDQLLRACTIEAPAMTDESIQVLQSYYSTVRAACMHSGHAQHTALTLTTLIRLCLASARLHLRDTTEVADCMLAIRLVEESMAIRCSGNNDKVLGAELHDLVRDADADHGMDEYLQHLGDTFAARRKDSGLASEE